MMNDGNFKEYDIIAEIGKPTKYLVYSWYPSTDWCELISGDDEDQTPTLAKKIDIEDKYVLLERDDDEC